MPKLYSHAGITDLEFINVYKHLKNKTPGSQGKRIWIPPVYGWSTQTGSAYSALPFNLAAANIDDDEITPTLSIADRYAYLIVECDEDGSNPGQHYWTVNYLRLADNTGNNYIWLQPNTVLGRNCWVKIYRARWDNEEWPNWLNVYPGSYSGYTGGTTLRGNYWLIDGPIWWDNSVGYRDFEEFTTPTAPGTELYDWEVEEIDETVERVITPGHWKDQSLDLVSEVGERGERGETGLDGSLKVLTRYMVTGGFCARHGVGGVARDWSYEYYDEDWTFAVEITPTDPDDPPWDDEFLNKKFFCPWATYKYPYPLFQTSKAISIIRAFTTLIEPFDYLNNYTDGIGDGMPYVITRYGHLKSLLCAMDLTTWQATSRANFPHNSVLVDTCKEYLMVRDPGAGYRWINIAPEYSNGDRIRPGGVRPAAGAAPQTWVDDYHWYGDDLYDEGSNHSEPDDPYDAVENPWSTSNIYAASAAWGGPTIYPDGCVIYWHGNDRVNSPYVHSMVAGRRGDTVGPGADSWYGTDALPDEELYPLGGGCVAFTVIYQELN